MIRDLRWFNKGADLFIEALARLNHRLKAVGSDVTIVAFIVMPTKTNNFNVESLRGMLPLLLCRHCYYVAIDAFIIMPTMTNNFNVKSLRGMLPLLLCRHVAMDAFIVIPTKTNNFNVESLRGLSPSLNSSSC